MSQEAYKRLSEIGEKAIKTQKNRNAARKNFAEVSNGISQVSNYRKVKSETNKRRTNPRPKVRLSKKNVSMNMPEKSEELENKITNYKELYLSAQEELAELRKRDELRTMMLTEDLRAFEEKRQEIFLARNKRRGSSTPHHKVIMMEDEKLSFFDIVKSHLKFLLLGIPPEDFCIINLADNMLQGAIDHQTMWDGALVNPFKVRLSHENFLREMTYEEYIETLKKGNIRFDMETCVANTINNLANKTHNFIRVCW